ncbi:MAG: hypothetical protein ACFFG0_14465 [Candidatus Thorarchaeota archaeon]
MEEKQTSKVIKTRILELEEKLMDIIEIASNYENIPVPVFESEMNEILNEIEYLESLIN